MMYNSPFFNFPFYRNFSKKYGNNYFTKLYHNNGYSSKKIYTPNYNLENYYNNFLSANAQKNNNIESTNNAKCIFKKSSENKNEETFQNELFEIFGLKLYFDDILLICLVFFLYNEGVKDYYLFISLILLLLS